jgi:hypothetical protein
MLALAFLTIAVGTEHTRSPAPTGQIPLTRNEIAAPFTKLVIHPAPAAWHRLQWPTRRRHHQHPCQAIPLPAASTQTMKITISGWSTKLSQLG